MAYNRRIRCPENEEIAAVLLKKREEMANEHLPENLDSTFATAYKNLCNSKTPIRTLKDFHNVKGVGKWLLRVMKDYFPDPLDNSPQKGKRAKEPRRYVPQKNSVAYALLITLYRGLANGKSYMKKQELIDAAEDSGLSRASIAPDKVKGKPGICINSPRDWYTGWSCMKTLVSKGLVVKSSNPAKYMLTQEGRDAARECMQRSQLTVPSLPLTSTNALIDSSNEKRPLLVNSSIVENLPPSTSLNYQKKYNDTAIMNFGGDISSDSDDELAESATLRTCSYKDSMISFSTANAHSQTSVLNSFNPGLSGLKACTSYDISAQKPFVSDHMEEDTNFLALPPRNSSEKFEETYDVILILDDRENFGSRSKKVVDSLNSQFNVQVEVRRLPVGDGIWIVRDKQSNKEYVLDFIVERKRVDDLCSSIRDNRYRDQKLKLQRCGLKKLIYLVEGDPNKLETAESIKTACFTTEILEGFDVQRTSGHADTIRKYGYLTKSISQYYSMHFSSNLSKPSLVCPTYGDFIRKCQDLEKLTVSDVFALQLMQVQQVTEEIALAVINRYPTVLSLARGYSLLEGNINAQEELLKKECRIVSNVASKNIYKLVWGT